MKETQKRHAGKSSARSSSSAPTRRSSRAQRNRQEHRRRDQEPGARRRASGSTPPPCTTSNTMRCARRRRPSSPPPAPRCWMPRPSSTPSWRRPNLSADDATQAARTVEQLGNVIANGNLMAADMTAALSANSQRHAGDDREGIQGGAATRVKSNLDLLPEQCRATTALTRRGAETAGARRGQDRRVQAAPEGTRRRRLRPDRSGRNPQAQCRPRHQRAAARRRRAEGDQRLDLAGAPGDLARDHGHAGARRR